VCGAKVLTFLKGTKHENNNNLSRFGFGIGGRLAFLTEVEKWLKKEI